GGGGKKVELNKQQKDYNKAVEESKNAKGDKGVTQAKPNQVHHFATNKSKKYTQQFEQITNKYKLNLDDMWNKELMPHQGRHPYAYHDYMLEQMKKFDKIANGNQDKFLKLYEQVKQKVINNPDMITKDYWNKK
ncbi:type IV secretion protein Rhs, partial [Clostridium estertheticum]